MRKQDGIHAAARAVTKEETSCYRHLRRHGALAFQLHLVPLEGLLSTVLELVAVVVLW